MPHVSHVRVILEHIWPIHESESDAGTYLPHPLDEGGYHVDPGPIVEPDGAPAEKTRRNLRLNLPKRKKEKKENAQKSIQKFNEGTVRINSRNQYGEGYDDNGGRGRGHQPPFVFELEAAG